MGENRVIKYGKLHLVKLRIQLTFSNQTESAVDNNMKITETTTWSHLILIALCAYGTSAVAADSIEDAARIAGVPRHVVEKIIKTESGGHPYSLNTNSSLGSFRFASKKAAEAALMTLLQKGYRNIDVGPAQINLRWHPDLYTNPADLLDTRQNILAAGHVLRKSKESETDSVRTIVGRYHSRRPERAQQYANMVLGEK